MTTKISALPSLASVTDATIIPVVEGGATKRITGAALKTYATGAQGTTGTTGSQGATGSGTQGTTGSTGSQGTTGSGTQGAVGAQGSTGTGTQGTTGSAGSQGATGPGTLNGGTAGYMPYYSASTTLSPVTSGNLFWDNTNSRLGIANASPTARLHISGGGNDLVQFGTKIFASCAGRVIYVATTGNDSTGTGSVGAPYLTISRAIQDIPYCLPYDAQISIGAGTFTVGSALTLRGRFGGGESEGRIFFTGAGSGSTTLAMGDAGGFYLYDVDVPVYFQSMNITCGNAYALSAVRCRWISFANTVTMSFTTSNAGWNARIRVDDSIYFECQAVITLTSGALAGLGGVIVLYGIQHVYLTGSITKTGTKFGNIAVSLNNGTYGDGSITIDNFATGMALGQNHYSAEGFAQFMGNGITIRNCTNGLYIYRGSTYINYSTTFTSNTQDVSNQDGNYSGQWNMYDRLGIGLSGSLATYKLQVNGQPAANGYTAWTNYSDARLKENVENFGTGTSVLSRVEQLRPVSFNYNESTGFDEDSRARRVSGFIAQELETVFPDMVGTTTIKDTEYLDTNLSNLNLYLVKAIQELKVLIDAQAAEIELLKAKGN